MILLSLTLSGKKNIFANRAHTISVNNVTAEESRNILENILFRQVDDLKYHYTHNWRDGDAVLWDNRGLQHKATQAPNTPRKLVRTTVIGKPVIEDIKLLSEPTLRRICPLAGEHEDL